MYGTKWTFLCADTTPNAEPFRNEGDLRLWGDFDTELARPHDRTGLFALLAAFLIVYQQQSNGRRERISPTLGLHYFHYR